MRVTNATGPVAEHTPRIGHYSVVVVVSGLLRCRALVVEKEAAEFLLGEILQSLVVGARHDLVGWKASSESGGRLGEGVILLIAALLLLSQHYVLLGGGGATLARLCPRHHHFGGKHDLRREERRCIHDHMVLRLLILTRHHHLTVVSYACSATASLCRARLRRLRRQTPHH